MIHKAIRRLPKTCNHSGWVDKLQHCHLKVTLIGKDRVTLAHVECTVCGNKAEARDSQAVRWMRNVGGVLGNLIALIGGLMLLGFAAGGLVDLMHAVFCCQGCK